METRLARWVNASLAILLKSTVVDELGMQFFVEGIDSEQKAFFQQDSAVLRVIGPTYYPGSSSDIYRFEVMVMITDMPSDTHNGYLNHNRTSAIANVLNGPIPVYQYPDSDIQAGCLDIDSNANTFLRVVPFGKLDPNTEVIQAAVIAYYEICLDS